MKCTTTVRWASQQVTRTLRMCCSYFPWPSYFQSMSMPVSLSLNFSVCLSVYVCRGASVRVCVSVEVFVSLFVSISFCVCGCVRTRLSLFSSWQAACSFIVLMCVSGASAGSLMAAMIGTRNEQDLVKMLDARSEYGRSLKRDYFKPKSEVNSPTGTNQAAHSPSSTHASDYCFLFLYA